MMKPKGKNEQFCELFRRRQCTGCTALHVPYPRQLEEKRNFVADCHGPHRAVVEKTVASPKPMGYRTSVKYCLHEDTLARKVYGLYQAGTKIVVPMRRCPAEATSINRLVEKLFGLPGKIPAKFYNHKGRGFQRGKLKFLTVRAAPQPAAAPDRLAIIISHTGVPRENMVRWLKGLGLGGLCAYESELVQRDNDLVVGRRVEHLSGPKEFPLVLGNHTFNLAPTAFFQANFSLGDSLIGAATAFQSDGGTLLDLYGGFGAYAFRIARRFKKIFVVDGNDAAIAAATAAAKEAKFTHLTARAAMCENFLKDLPAAEKAAVTHVIVNPPRSGLSQQVVAAMSREAMPLLRELHYVSCDPETQARDVAALCRLGFTVAKITPFDMFPQTDHVEAVARLVRV